MLRRKTKQEYDILKYVLCDQLIHRGILSKEEVVNRKQMMADIADQYQGFLDDQDTSDKRMSVSHGIAKRRNAMYKSLLDQILPKEEARLLELHIYHCIEHGVIPDTRILTAHLNIDYDA